MSDQSMIGTDQHSRDPDPVAAMIAAQQLWQLPLTLYTSWWNAGVEALWPQTHPQPPMHHDEHVQLVVPEPIESDGERALFA